ncbi:hypothetical protein AB4589_25165 [Vibrio sp. 10N.222.49.A3]|uniref:hypothetical protein n=1 Tax=Vibrio sp. 10N.222.49.A3 TaxID=3229611 RepID=UPI0035519EAE
MNKYIDISLLRKVMAIIHNAVEVACTSASIKQKDEALASLVDAHSDIYNRLKEMEGSNNDSLQTPHSNVSAPTKSVMVSNDQADEVQAYECFLLGLIIKRMTIPWDVERSIKSIERRIKSAIKLRDFAKAARLNNASIAISNIHNHCQERLNATR